MNRQSASNLPYSRFSRGLSLLLTWLLLTPGTSLSFVSPLSASEMRPAGTDPAADPEFRASGVPYPEQTANPTATPAPSRQAGSNPHCSPLGDTTANAYHVGGPTLEEAQEEAEKWGDITIAATKIWQYERVNTYLDGLLRDVEAVSLADLTQLDPNAQNAGVIKFVQSALEIGVQYSQIAGETNKLAIQAWHSQLQSQQQQYQNYTTNLQTLEQQRNSVIQSLVSAQSQLSQLQLQTDNGANATSTQSAQLTTLQSQVTALNSELTNLNAAITGMGAPPALRQPRPCRLPGVRLRAPLSVPA